MRRVLPLLLALACAACPAEDPKPPVDPVCDATKPCVDGMVCQIGAKPEENACVACKFDNECKRTEFCHPVERRCRLMPCFGTDCKVHDDCGLGEFCVQGLCLRGSESTAEGCKVVTCAEGEICDAGQRCNPVNLVCEEDLGCSADVDCGDGMRCIVSAGRCELGCTPDTAAAVCGVTRVCADGACVDCTTDEHCGAGLNCDRERKICVAPFSCVSTRDCEPPLVCNSLTKQCTVDPGPCLSNEDCGIEDVCQLSSGKCVPALCVPDRYEPNDTLATARTIVVGAHPNLSLCQGDVDHLAVPLKRGDRLLAVVDVDPLLNADIALLGLAGEVLAEGEFALTATVSVDGTYVLRLSSRDAYVRYGLRLTVSRGVPCDDDEDEENDDVTAAKPLEPGEYDRRSVCPADEDWWTIAVKSGDTVEVEVVHTALDGDLDVVLYDGDGRRELARSATTADTEIVRSNQFTGSRVYARVFGATPAQQNRYDLVVRVRR